MHWISVHSLISRRFILLLITTLLVNRAAFAQAGCTDPLASNYNAAATSNNGSCLYPATTLNLTNQKDLSATLNEGSALVYTDGNLWTLNDGGNTAEIYRLNPATGAILQTLKINAANNDWEDLAADADHVYVGDFGNNANGNRTNLRIIQINKSDLGNTDPAGIPASIISFTYADQTIEVPVTTGPNATAFDCEAFFVKDGIAHLFTKDWVTNKTRHYSLPATPGSQVATFVEEFNVAGLITAGDVSPSGAVVLTGYTADLANAFVYLLGDYSAGKYFNGNKRKLNLGLTVSVGQVEGITFVSGLTGYISSEQINRTVFGFPVVVPPRLYSFDASNLVSLPVSLASFTVSQESGRVLLQWSTNAEYNSDYFMVEHSTSAQQYAEIGRKAGAGNSSIQKQYNFYDDNPAPGMNFYRLKQVDSDGNVSVLGIRSISIAVYSGQMKLYPSPVSGTSIAIDYGQELPTGLKYRVINAAGATLGSGSLVSRRQQLHIGQLPPGQYVVKLSNGFSIPFIKH